MTKARDLAVFNAAGVLTSTSNLNASNLTSGTIPNARYGTPTFNGSNLTGIDAGGNTPAFAAKISGGDHSIVSNNNTVVRFGAEDFDTDSAYDTANYRFVVPSEKAGKYYFSSRIYMEYGNNANEIGRLQICKNGTAMAIFGGLANGTENQGKSLSVDTVLDLSVGDYVDVRIYHNQGGTQAIDDDPDFSYFYGYKIS